MTKSQTMRLSGILPPTFRAMILYCSHKVSFYFKIPPLSCICIKSDRLFSEQRQIFGERDGTQVEMILFAGFVYFIISFSASMLVELS